MELSLKGKCVLVTGGSKSIGRACADAFATERAQVRFAHVGARSARQGGRPVKAASYRSLPASTARIRMSYSVLPVPTMDTTKLSAKGQVVLPKGVRDAYGWNQGVEFVVEPTSNGVLLRAKARKKSSRVAELAGMLRRKGRKRVSIRTMAAAIESEILARRARGRY
jgi:AbrB family looped-hinge helix DNA binding protein